MTQNPFCDYISSSIGRKQIVAVTGLLLILFLIGHLAGNLIIYLGPAAYNHYAEKLTGLRPGLYVVEAGLLFVFLAHIWFTALLVLENIRARPRPYASYRPKGHRSLATRLMPYTGTLIFAFVVCHLLDFTFIDKHGPRSILSDGQSYALYGVVYNAFTDPLHSIFYIAAMAAIGFHLIHGVESFVQTSGWNHPTYTPLVQKLSGLFGWGIAIAYSSIPVYVLLKEALK